MNRLHLALRLLFRDGRSGELTILVLALVIAVSSSTAISLFGDRLQRTMETQAAEFLAADLVIASPTLIPPVWRAKALQLGLKMAETAEFSSVLIENDELLLAGVKAVSPAYPLRGYLKATESDYTAEQKVHTGPESGTAWVDKRILSALKMKLGDMLQVGEKNLRITRIVTYEPDKRGDFYSLSPRVMINIQNLQATEILKPGSHVHYFFQFAGSVHAIKAFNRWVKPQLNPSQRIMDIHDDRPEIGDALTRAEKYLGLSSIVVILIAGVAIAMATRRYTERHFDATAILRCLGCKQAEILRLYSSQFIILGITASLLGCLLGWFAQEGLFYLLRNLLPQTVASPGPLALGFGFITGMAILMGFALPPLLRLKQVSPLRVLRRELEPLPSSAWLVYSLALSVIAVLIWQYTQDLKLTASILGAGSLAIVILSAGIYFMLSASRKLLPKLSLTWRFGLQGLIRQPQSSVSQILAFSITLVAMILSFTVRNDLLDNWQAQLPDKAPNHFAVNIFPDQKNAFEQDLQKKQIAASLFYQIVRGRLVEINGIGVKKIVSKDSQGERATHRDLSLTTSKMLPEGNKITSGHWWTSSQTNLVSVEQQLAKSLKIKLGDELTYSVGSQQFKAIVINIRYLNWDTMKPNFYMIFSPGTLNTFPSTYITSFYLPQENKHYLNDLHKSYPSVTVVEVDLILRQIKKILAQITEAINYMLVFALLAGFTVLFASVYATLDNRIYDGTLLRTLGAKRSLLRWSQFIEFSILGLIASLLAVIIAEIIAYFLYSHVLHIDYQVQWLLLAVMPICGSLFVGLAGCWGVRDVVNKSPMQVLRQL
jgi:putative ABC transport system permease protein